MTELVPITRLIAALRPWLNELVIVGGWAHHLYRLHPKALLPTYLPLGTRDADVALPARGMLKGNIGKALKEAGFHKDFMGEHNPPVIQYRLGEEDHGFYAEFLVPMIGNGLKPDGSPDVTVGRAGVTAQKLRHLNLLLIEPWIILLDTSAELSVAAHVRLPNPVSFIAQKLLIKVDRPAHKQAQDILYIHDTLDLFGPELEALRADWEEKLRRRIAQHTAKRIERLARAQFTTVTDVIRSAARLPQDRTVSPEHLRMACEYGLQGIFGSE